MRKKIIIKNSFKKPMISKSYKKILIIKNINYTYILIYI